MHYKRRKARRRARESTHKVGVWPWIKPRVKGNAWDRFRVQDYGKRTAMNKEIHDSFEDDVCIRVLLGADVGIRHHGCLTELYRIPVNAGFVMGSTEEGKAIRRKMGVPTDCGFIKVVREMMLLEPLVKEVCICSRTGDVQVVLDEMLDEVRKRKGIEAVTPLVEGIVSRLAEAFADPKLEVEPVDLCCPKCLNSIEWGNWDQDLGMCRACSWDEMNDDEDGY